MGLKLRMCCVWVVSLLVLVINGEVFNTNRLEEEGGHESPSQDILQDEQSQEDTLELTDWSLDPSTTDEKLKTAFGNFVVKKAKIVEHKHNGRNHRIGVLLFDTLEEGEAAAKAMQGQALDGRALKVTSTGKNLKELRELAKDSRNSDRNNLIFKSDIHVL